MGAVCSFMVLFTGMYMGAVNLYMGAVNLYMGAVNFVYGCCKFRIWVL